MLSSDIEKFLAQWLEFMGIHLPDQTESLARLSLYFHELKKWNRKINLVARTMEDQQILENHFLDSLTLLQVLKRESQVQETMMDVGSGAGFPGLVLKAVCPWLSVLLVEPRKNRYYFLKHIVRTLNLQDVELLNERLGENDEKLKLSGRKFTLITSRAFTDILQFVRLTAPYLDSRGRIVCMKGPGADEELAMMAQNELPEKLAVAETIKLRLPVSKAERVLVIIKAAAANLQ